MGRICFWFVITAQIIFTKGFAQEANLNQNQFCKIEITVASGRTDGRYFEFVDAWANFERLKKSELCIENRRSNGSTDNVGRLEKEEVEFAIIQGDIGHHSFYGRNGYPRKDNFLGIKPLYREYIQMLVLGKSGNNLPAISSLNGKTIAAGSEGSGGRWNAIDILSAAGLFEGYNFQFYQGGEHPVIALKEGKADAAFYTSAKIHDEIIRSGTNQYSFIRMSRGAAKQLSINHKKAYYDFGELKLRRSGQIAMIPSVSVHSYLVVNQSVDSSVVGAVTQSINEFLKHIPNRDGPLKDLDLIKETPQDRPFDMHFMSTSSSGSKAFGRAREYITSYWSLMLASFFAVATIYARFAFRRRKYNSIGLLDPDSTLSKLQALSFEVSKYAIGIATWFVALVVISILIIAQEETFSQARGIDSPLEGFGITDGVIWLVKTAFTTLPGEVPLSVASSILIPITVILGVGAFLYPVQVGYSAIERKNLRQANGDADFHRLRDHVVVCGWNERAQGTILSLISEFAPKTKQVVVIADIGADEPLVKLGFDQRRVHYVRGDASKTDNLRRAGAEYASEAVILANDSNTNTRNLASVLTAVALSNFSNKGSELFVCAELVYQENKQAFLNAGVKAFVQVEDIADKIAAASSVSAGVSDFMIDFLTFDDHFELYSKRVSKLPRNLLTLSQADTEPRDDLEKDEIINVSKLRQVMLASGFQLLGISNKNNDVDYSAIELCNARGDDHHCSEKDRVVYFSVLKEAINKARWFDVDASNENVLPELEPRPVETILLIGNIQRLATVSNALKNIGASCVALSIEQVVSHINALVENEHLQNLQHFSKVVVLDELQPLLNQSCEAETVVLETTSVLIVKYLATMRAKTGFQFTISSEVRSHKDRELYKMTGVDDILVRNSLLERLLAKMVFNHGRMYDVINRLLTLNNGVFMESYLVKAGSEFEGVDIRELFSGSSSTYQVCGWLPYRMQGYLKSNAMGFETHWITALNSKPVRKMLDKNAKVMKGDWLMILKMDSELSEY